MTASAVLPRLLAAALLAGAAAVGGGARAQTAEPFGDPDRGEALWAFCSRCHQIGPDAANAIGPHLNDIFGRRAASVEGYGYSPAMERAGDDGLTWSRETLDLYIETPKRLVTGTRMAFAGLKHAGDRADLIAWLRAWSANPRDIPEAAPTARGTDHDIDPEILAIQGDPAYGEYLSGECVSCHKVDGADEGIPSVTGWPERDFVIAMQAYKREQRPHPVMRMIAGRLSDEEIASLAAYFASLE
ncbi:MAG: c-type cytochrome [Pseudomonadota bacterium]